MKTTSRRRLRRGLAIVAVALAGLGSAGGWYRGRLAETRRAREWTRGFSEWDAIEQGGRVEHFADADWTYLINGAARPDNRFDQWRQTTGPWQVRVRIWTRTQVVGSAQRNAALDAAWGNADYHPEARRLALIEVAIHAKPETARRLMEIATHGQPPTPGILARLRQLASSGPTRIRIGAAAALFGSHSVDDTETGKLLLALERDSDTNMASAAKGFASHRHGIDFGIPTNPPGQMSMPTRVDLPSTLWDGRRKP